MEINEKNGLISLTKKQAGIIVAATEGKEGITHFGGARGGNGSSKQEIERKVYEGTGWEKMKFVQLCCRFGYKHGMVKL